MPLRRQRLRSENENSRHRRQSRLRPFPDGYDAGEKESIKEGSARIEFLLR